MRSLALLLSLLFSTLCSSFNCSSRINLLNDPIITIYEFLSRDSQNNLRIVNRRFNHFYTQSNPNMMEIMFNFSKNAHEIIIRGIIKNDTMNALRAIHERYKFNEIYMKRWPKIVGRWLVVPCQTPKKIWTRRLMHFLSTLNMKPWNKTSAKSTHGVAGLLVMMSNVVFDGVFFDKRRFVKFHLFLYKATWAYLTTYKLTLPPLNTLYYLDRNRDLYSKQISNLIQLHEEHGLIVWNPALLEIQFDHHEFHAYIGQYLHFKQTFEDKNEVFFFYLQIELVLKLLDNHIYDLSEMAKFGNHDFIHMTRQSVHYLWTYRIWNPLHQILIGLHDNNGLSILNDDYFLMQLCGVRGDGNITESFIGILLELYANSSLVFVECSHLSKSLFFWCMDNEKHRAMNHIAILSKNGLLNASLLGTLTSFVTESSLFYFVANETKQEYLDTITSFFCS